MRDRLGEEFGGVVSAATGFGLFVTLDDLFVDGLVHVTELGGEYFRFDEIRQELRGERSGLRFGVGTRLRVQVSRVDLDSRRIDFRLVRDAAVLKPHGAVGGASGESAVALLERTKSEDRALKAERKTRAPRKSAGPRTSAPSPSDAPPTRRGAKGTTRRGRRG
ncbi:MAG: ribonuclease [Pseudomonadota bacterium]|jgi:ribonuclease R